MPGYYSPDLKGDTKFLTLDRDETHHLIHVMRQKCGNKVRLNSGQGWIAEGVLRELDKNLAVIEIEKSAFIKPPEPRFAIAFSLLRNKNDAWLVEKTTELGVAELFPLITHNSVRSPSTNTIDKFKATALSAIKQCDNPYLPAIHPVLSLQQVLDEITFEGYQIVVASELRPDVWLDSLELTGNYCFIIGPEGGFEAEEFALMDEYKVQSIALSSNILRAETAAVAIAAQFNLLRKS